MEDLRAKVAEGMRKLYERGLVSSLGGNLSIRSEDRTRIFITPSGSPKWTLQAEDIVEVDMEGNVLNGIKRPSSELPSHLLIYSKRPDVCSVVHAHPVHAVALANSGLLKPPLNITPEEVLYLNRLSLIDFALPGKGTAEALSGVIPISDVIVIKNHGAFSFGKNVEEAIARIEILEEASKMIYLQLSIEHEPKRIPKEIAEEIKKIYKKD